MLTDSEFMERMLSAFPTAEVGEDGVAGLDDAIDTLDDWVADHTVEVFKP